MRAIRTGILLSAWAMSAGVAAQPAPTPLEAYGRVTALMDYMAVHVVELLLACAAKNVLTEAEAEARFQAYRKRNAALRERAEAWSADAEKRLEARGEGRAAQLRGEESSLTAMAAGSARAQREIAAARDPRAACAARIAAIESGGYDLSGNAELVELLREAPR